MKFPSVKSLADSAVFTFKRFPLETLFALTGTIATIVNIELDNIDLINENRCTRVMMAANLGFLLTLSATLFSESRKVTSSVKAILRAAAIAVAVILFIVLDPGVRQSDHVRFILLSLSAHLLVAFAAFTGKERIQGFWQFNKTLFLRSLTAALYSIVLGIGLSAAIGAVNYLFNFDFELDTFQILWTVIVGMFSTIFFLAGVPDNYEELNADESYPKGLKIFTQYVLIPLATVYVLILLAYEVKIISEWNLPKGAVAYLILSYSVFGILSLLLVYPIREQQENKWLKTYARSFYFLMLPLLGLLFAAVGVRVFRYGITEMRYFLILLACWLLFITLYFLLFKRQNIKLIPISLCVAALLTVYGPQSAFSVSEYSQRKVFAQLLQKNNALKNGRAVPLKKISMTDGERIQSVVSYLISYHGLQSLQPFFNENLDNVSDSLGNIKTEHYIRKYALLNSKVDWVENKLNVKSYYKDKNITHGEDMIEHYFNADANVLTVKGYDYVFPVSAYNIDINENVPAQTVNGIRFRQVVANKTYFLFINNEKFSFNLNDIAKQLVAREKEFINKKYGGEEAGNYFTTNKFSLPFNQLLFTKQTSNYTVALVIENFTSSQNGDIIEVSYIKGNFLIKKK